MKWYQRKSLRIIIPLLIIAQLADMITTYLGVSVTDGALETNPLMYFINDFNLVVLIISLVIIGWIIFSVYYYTSHNSSASLRFFIILLFVFFVIMKGYVAWNNYELYQNPPSQERVDQIISNFEENPGSRVQIYVRSVLPPLLFSVLPGLIAFWLFRKDHIIEII